MLLKFLTFYLFGGILGMLSVMLQPKDLDLEHNIRILPLKEGMDPGKSLFAQGGSYLQEGHNLTNHLLNEIRAGKHDG